MSTLSPRHAQVSELRRDYVAWAVALGAATLSVVAFIVTRRAGAVLAYGDSFAHSEISRRVMVGVNGGLAQLGSVWLPLPHVLMLPFVWIDSLYYSGFAGAIVSMLAFVVATVFVYKIVVRLLAHRSTVSRKAAGVLAAAVFALNMNVLYMQSTPMTELLLFATLLGAVYNLLAWADTQRLGALIGSAAWGMLATLTRYESWPVVGVLMAVTIVIAIRRVEPDLKKGGLRHKLEEVAIVYGLAAFAGITGWLLWNLVIFGDMFSFYSGEYAKPALWMTGNDPNIGDFWLSVKTFGFSLVNNVPWLLAVVAGVGLVVLVAAERLNVRILPVLSLLVVVPFLIWALYKGERPLHVPQIHGDMYNVRFGLIMVLPTAIFVGYLVGFIGKLRVVAVALATVTALGAGALAVLTVQTGTVMTLNEPRAVLGSEGVARQSETARQMRDRYDGGLVLMESFGNERVEFEGVPSRQHVYEGTNKQERWKRSLADPAGMNIRWIVVRCLADNADKVCGAIKRNPSILDGYELVYEYPKENAYRIYKRVNN